MAVIVVRYGVILKFMYSTRRVQIKTKLAPGFINDVAAPGAGAIVSVLLLLNLNPTDRPVDDATCTLLLLAFVFG